MAKVHTVQPPIHEGEKRVARILSGMDDDDLHLWFSVNYIPGVNDLDVLLWHEAVGIFVIEIKAHVLRDIEAFSLES